MIWHWWHTWSEWSEAKARRATARRRDGKGNWVEVPADRIYQERKCLVCGKIEENLLWP